MTGRALAAVLLALGLALAGCAPRLQDPGPLAAAPAPPQLSDSAFVAADGTALPLRRWLPADNPHPKPPRAVVGALHGFNDYSNAFDGIAGFLADNGVAVYAYDQRGFGAAPQTGLWPGTGRLTGDARDFFATLRARHPGVPVFAMGESMGGAVLLAAETEAPLDVAGFVLVAPAVWGRATMPFYQTGALWLTAHTLPWLTVTGRGLNIRPSDNIEMLRALSRDPLVIRQTRVDAVWGLVNLMDTALDAAPRFAAPALFLYGARDELVPAEPTLRLYDGLPEDGAVTIAIYGEGYHMLLRDLQAETVWRDVLAWIGDPTAPLPSGAEAVDPKAALAKD